MSVGAIIGIVLLALVVLLVVLNRKRFIAFAKASRAEMRKVLWPTRERAFSQTRIVVISLVVFAVVFGAIDFALYHLVSAIF